MSASSLTLEVAVSWAVLTSFAALTPLSLASTQALKESP
jgi:hypothetical protein